MYTLPTAPRAAPGARTPCSWGCRPAAGLLDPARHNKALQMLQTSGVLWAASGRPSPLSSGGKGVVAA